MATEEEEEEYGGDVPDLDEELDADEGDEDDDAGEDLEEMKKKLAEMEEEAAKLREMSAKVERDMAGAGGAAAAAAEGADGAAGAGAPAPPTQEEREAADARSVYIGNVDYATTPEELQVHFAECGTVDRVTIQTDRCVVSLLSCSYMLNQPQ